MNIAEVKRPWASMNTAKAVRKFVNTARGVRNVLSSKNQVKTTSEVIKNRKPDNWSEKWFDSRFYEAESTFNCKFYITSII